MWTVIIPTLWKSSRIHQLLFDLNKCEEVGQIIIIDNANSKDFVEMAKEFRVPMPTNIYVNPAWNMGVELAKYDNICIANDDINFDTSIFKTLDPHITGLGICGQMFENYSIKETQNIKTFDVKERPYGWGCLMFLHKSNYVTIPDELKIACGDDYLIRFAPRSTQMLGLQISSDISTTTQLPEFGEQQIKDYEYFTQHYK
jgi:hypothetical protein